jgi:purine-nucleoside phosphorylase
MQHHSPQAPRLDAAASFVKSRTPLVPRVALVLGSGLGDYADTLAARTVIPFAQVPGMPQSHVVGHAGNLVLGHVGEGGLPVIAMQGRVHLYEGHPVADVVFGVRLMIRLGASIVLVTNAAGGLAEGMQPGDLMRIDDHLNLTAQSPLTGTNESALGVRFPDMTRAYDPALGALAQEVAQAQGFSLLQGVYAGMLGPQYETPAEVRMLRTLGAHAVGMSTVLETIAARHMGARVLGISCITNVAAGLSSEVLDHAEVTDVAARVKGRFTGLLEGVLRGIAAGRGGGADQGSVA